MTQIASPQLLQYLTQNIFERIHANQCTTLLIFSASGVNAELRYLAKDQIADNKKLIAFLDLQTLAESADNAVLDTISLLKQVYKTLTIASTAQQTFQDLNEYIQTLLENNYSVNFVLSNFYLLFGQDDIAKRLKEYLKTLRRTDPDKVSFTFVIESEYSEEDILSLDWIGGLVTQHIVNGKDMLFDKESAKIQIDNQEKLSDTSFLTEFKDKLIKTTYGDPYTLKMIMMKAVNNIPFQKDFIEKENDDLYILIGSENLGLRFERIVSKLKKTSLECLVNDYANPTKFLTATGLLIDGKPLNILFDLYVKQNKEYLQNLVNSSGKKKATDTDDTDHALKSSLTGQELLILNFLESKMGTTIPREELAQIIWGTKWEEAYSDWALDQATSRLRNKLKTGSYPQTLKSIKGKGFILA